MRRNVQQSGKKLPDAKVLVSVSSFSTLDKQAQTTFQIDMQEMQVSVQIPDRQVSFRIKSEAISRKQLLEQSQLHFGAMLHRYFVFCFDKCQQEIRASAYISSKLNSIELQNSRLRTRFEFQEFQFFEIWFQFRDEFAEL